MRRLVLHTVVLVKHAHMQSIVRIYCDCLSNQQHRLRGSSTVLCARSQQLADDGDAIERGRSDRRRHKKISRIAHFFFATNCVERLVGSASASASIKCPQWRDQSRKSKGGGANHAPPGGLHRLARHAYPLESAGEPPLHRATWGRYFCVSPHSTSSLHTNFSTLLATLARTDDCKHRRTIARRPLKQLFSANRDQHF